MKKYFVFAGIILLFGLVINYSLGGFETIKPNIISTYNTTIYGFLYEGSHASDSLANQVALLRKILDDGDIIGTLTIVNYIQPALEKRGVIRQFIGIETEHYLTHNRYSLDSLKINSYNGIQFRIPIRPLVMPSPEKLKKLAKEAAISMNSELASYSIEYYKDKFLITNFPLQ